MPNQTEQLGIEKLKQRLLELGHKVEKSDNKTFDLVVDGQYAEVKTKNKPYKKIDFISFTDKQHKNLSDDYIIYLVCNVASMEGIEIYRFRSNQLVVLALEKKEYTSHEYKKTALDKINKAKI